MYQIGDKVVYPVHGAGWVEAIENREVAGLSRSYYVLRLPLNDLRIMVPQEEAEKIGLRDLMPPEATERVLRILEGKQSEAEMSQTVRELNLEKWNTRFRLQMSSIKNGNVYELAEIVHILTVRDRLKPLSTGERKIFEQAKEILFSELWLISNDSQPEISERIKTIINADDEFKAVNSSN